MSVAGCSPGTILPCYFTTCMSLGRGVMSRGAAKQRHVHTATIVRTECNCRLIRALGRTGYRHNYQWCYGKTKAHTCFPDSDVCIIA